MLHRCDFRPVCGSLLARDSRPGGPENAIRPLRYVTRPDRLYGEFRVTRRIKRKRKKRFRFNFFSTRFLATAGYVFFFFFSCRFTFRLYDVNIFWSESNFDVWFCTRVVYSTTLSTRWKIEKTVPIRCINWPRNASGVENVFAGLELLTFLDFKWWTNWAS